MRRGRKVHSKIALASIAAFGCSAPTAAVSAPTAPVTTTSATVAQVRAPALEVEPDPERSRSGRRIDAPSPAQVIGDPNPAPVISRMEAFYALNMPFEADIEIEQFFKQHNVKKSELAKLVFDRRGRYQMTFKNGAVYQAEAGRFTAFDKTAAFASRHTIPLDHCPAVFAFAMQPGTIAGSMGLQRFDGIGMNAPGTDVILATPHQPHRSVSKVLFYVRPTGEVPRMMVIPPNGDRLQVSFNNIKPNAKWPGSLQLPPGTQISTVPQLTQDAGSPQPAQSPFLATIP